MVYSKVIYMVNGVKLNSIKCPKGCNQIFYDCLCLCHLLKQIINSLVFCTVYFNSSKLTKVQQFYFLCTIQNRLIISKFKGEQSFSYNEPNNYVLNL